MTTAGDQQLRPGRFRRRQRGLGGAEQVEALRFDGTSQAAVDVDAWMRGYGFCCEVMTFGGGEPMSLRIPTREGSRFARAGDWIVCAGGEFSVCAAEVFERTFAAEH